MATSLYQDDGYFVRVVLGDLTEVSTPAKIGLESPTNFSLLLSSQHLQQTRNALWWTFLNLFLLGCLEKSEWTARTTWKINLESGKMVVSGVADEDLENYMEDFPVAETGGDYELGCFVEIPKGEYSLTIYSYPPNDLSGGWMRIENPSLFRDCFGKDSDLKYEKPLDYFTRTRPDEPPPAWVKDGYESEDFLNFVIHLAPLSDKLTAPEFEPDGCLLWTFRKPDRCPKGIKI